MAHDRREPRVDVESLASLNIDALRHGWRLHLCGPVPPLRAAELLRRELAWRLEAHTHGAMSARLKQRLDTLARQTVGGKVDRAPASHLNVGATLVREWDGIPHTVIVLEKGFLYEGKTWRSLSAIARHITGVQWSGPRFFRVDGHVVR